MRYSIIIKLIYAFLSRVRAAEAGDRAKVLEEFWHRKRAALANKNRGGKPIGGPSVVSRFVIL